MMSRKIKQSAAILMVLAAVVVFFSSCNRGMGCPNNFSIEASAPQQDL